MAGNINPKKSGMSKQGRDEDHVGEKMSEASDQDVRQVKGKPALDKNIKDIPEDELKEDIADKMSQHKSK